MPVTTVRDELEARVSFRTIKTDYGVPGSPVWDEIEDSTLELESLWMFGQEWHRSELLEMFGNQGTDALESLIFSQIEEWDDE